MTPGSPQSEDSEETWELDLSSDAAVLQALCAGEIDLLVAEMRLEDLDRPPGRILPFIAQKRGYRPKNRLTGQLRPNFI